MAQVCKSHDGEKKAACRKQADSFSGLTGSFGGGFHVNGQKSACDCFATKAEAQARHESYLMSFYEAYFTVMKKYAKAEIVWDNIKDEF
eukprot:1018171-Prorocentrum_minimum.AAC.3